MRDGMKLGDFGLFYHSSCKIPGVVGVVEIVKEAYPDHTALDPDSNYYDPKSTPDDPRWCMVDVKLRKKFKQIIPLQTLKTVSSLEGMVLLKKGSRLSIQPVSRKHWDIILELSV